MTLKTDKTAGDEVDSRCLKCKDVTNHTIIAMTGDTIAKVQCNTCGGRHNYRPPVADKKKASSVKRRRDGKVTEKKSGTTKAKAKKTTTGKKVLRAAVNFEALIQDKDVNAAIPYTIDAILAVGDLVDHSKFGLGVVTEIKPPNKAEIIFRELGSKLMLCKLG